eukprot:TRINITY_DN28159_c0_g1_i1.p1 TRINITY_DN28159_c0_g1~~TRINITY_DN28159_c0_g1_i1.p1  ORF type:complete len:371 (+),score=124.94 TRINITY_DN28159_c0_g1_i1:34-1146(+)
MASTGPARAGRTVAKSMGMPLQARPATGKHPVIGTGPGFRAATRKPMAGITEPAAHNERPFMTWKDKWRSSLGYHTHSQAAPQFTFRGARGPMGAQNMALAEQRVAKFLHTSGHLNLHFNGSAPGKVKANTFAVEGPRALSSKFVPLEMSGDGLLFVHPSSQELLQMTQNKIRADAKANGEDVDAKLDAAVENVLSNSPAQPYLYKCEGRTMFINSVREQIMRQEGRLHKRRMDKGLPVPPKMLRLYSHEYPEDVNDNRPHVKNNMMFFHVGRWSNSRRFGSILVKHSDAQVARARRRNTEYIAELRRQGVKFDDLDNRRLGHEAKTQEREGDNWDIATERAVRRWGQAAPLEADEVIEGGAEEPVLASD